MNPLDTYQSLWEKLVEQSAGDWANQLNPLLESKFDVSNNGNLKQWIAVLDALPEVTNSNFHCDRIVSMGGTEAPPVSDNDIDDLLRRLHPWRKGPLEISGVHIDTEWRSDWKWDRLRSHIAPLDGRSVLDVGCGNGYHCWRMYHEGADWVLGIDPTLLFVMQYLACKHFALDLPVWVLPLGIEELPCNTPRFDTVFSMGVLYHRRSPIDHLYELQNLIRPGGELVLETLVVDGPRGYSLMPSGRYAQMRNVWFLPSCETLCSWLERCGFVNVRIVDVTKTSTQEQRSTDWMQFQSLADFLDPDDPEKTIEGYPAPTRAIAIAERKP